MPSFLGRLSRNARAPSLEPAGSSVDDGAAAGPVEWHNPNTGHEAKPSFRTEIKRLFKGDAKTETGRFNANQDRHPNMDPLLQPSLVADSTFDTGGPHNSKRSRSVRSGSSADDLLIAGPPIGVDQLRGAENARFPGSRPASYSKEGAKLVDKRNNVAVHVDRRSECMLGPLQAMVESRSGVGFLANANNVVVNQPTMIDQSRTTHVVNNLIHGKTVLEILYQAMTKGADVDSSVRWPQPKCYPGTRITLTAEIHDWFLHDIRKRDFLWLSGPAGVGKSAVAQTVAEFAIEKGVLGATYFFSRPNKRFKYNEVFITLAYQLTIRFPGYRPLVTAKLAAEPDLLEKTPRVQFRKLIVEPLLLLSHERKHVIILDGLDECDGEDAQLEIIELINNLLHPSTTLPIIWMICSRPESHLKRIFARTDYAIQCWKEFLPIDSEESRSDTETFIRGRFKEIHQRYGECVEEGADGSWPRGPAIEQIVEKTSGLFVFADTLLKYIEDSETHDPDERLGEVLAFLRHSHLTGSRHPMHDLDLFYTRILSNIPRNHWSVTRQILVASTFTSPGGRRLAVQPMCNLLGITRARFYVVMRQLHSVINIPEPSDATETPLHFFHTTFLDYLTDINRAGRFFIGKLVTTYDITMVAGLREFVSSGLRCLGSTAGLSQVEVHEDKVRGNQEVSRSLKTALSWPSEDAHTNWERAAAAVMDVDRYFFEFICILLKHSELDDQVLSVLRGWDFNILAFVGTRLVYSPLKHLNILQKSSLIRTQGISEWDQTLLSKVAVRYPNMNPFVSLNCSIGYMIHLVMLRSIGF
ncbi:hypothetical protein P691DRAFT_714725 [Macrolepiota fuliginosa MF-IS2]|uniref:Nephrocystin 3-like N-terminal domain-containing protein n=1 Tax=Macrolepiota fuliginosa MF-IS2 TaxID=1400762 RepID=A0A9P6BXU5_9AGAR|nr:hypothetical protein P691DRAFT_714725 [Macrolepiota fuliginosa MF-IS2]